MARGSNEESGRPTPGAEPGPGTPPRFFELLRVLCEHQVEFVLIGGFAVSLHGYVRTTKDIDIVPAPSLENLARLWDALVVVQARPADFEEFAPDEPPVPFSHAGLVESGGNWALYTTLGRVDLLLYVETADGEIPYGALRRSAERVDLDEVGHPFWIASVHDLIAMKEHANRDIDRIDITALRMAQGQEE